MDTTPAPHSVTPAAANVQPERIDDLFTLILADGLPAEQAGQAITYRKARLRETTVADEREAERLSERAMLVGGSYKLLVSESNFKHVLNMLHIDSLHCDQQSIPRSLISLDLYDKLSVRDLELLEQRIFLITMAAEVRYGNITLDYFNEVMAGLATPGTAAAQAAPPQPVGQAAAVGTLGVFAQPGPALLTDYVRDAAQSAPGRAGAPA